jgi:hypothetical protein
MESNSLRNSIHMSEEAAKHVMQQDKTLTVEKRDPAVNIKGIGKMTTYWLVLDGVSSNNNSSSECPALPLEPSFILGAEGESVSMHGSHVSVEVPEMSEVALDVIPLAPLEGDKVLPLSVAGALGQPEAEAALTLLRESHA